MIRTEAEREQELIRMVKEVERDEVIKEAMEIFNLTREIYLESLKAMGLLRETRMESASTASSVKIKL